MCLLLSLAYLDDLAAAICVCHSSAYSFQSGTSLTAKDGVVGEKKRKETT